MNDFDPASEASPESPGPTSGQSPSPTSGGAPADAVLVVLVTGPDAPTLRGIGRTLVEERLIACANVVEGVASIFRWEGALEETTEALGILKTTARRLVALERRLRELHPYDVPELLALPADRGSAPYLAWVRECVQGGAET